MSDEKKLSILIVDDVIANISILNSILKYEYVVYVAKTGKCAIRRAREDKPDLILLDIMLPDMSGFDVLVDLKESDETRSIPVIFITGLASAEDEEKGLFLGAVDYITKPFNNSIVKARVKNQLNIVRNMRTIEKLGMIDALTEIPNRRSFDAHMQKAFLDAVQNKTLISLLMLDVDHFKKYNDTYGHPQGDLALNTLAGVFIDSLNNPKDFAARIGGEEFAVIMPGIDLNGAIDAAGRIIENVREIRLPSPDNSFQTSITVSIGIHTGIPEDEEMLSEFIKQADDMLYEAKRNGRDRMCFSRT